MKVNIGSISEQKGASLYLDQQAICPTIDLPGQDVDCTQPLELDLTLTNTGECIIIRGKITTEVSLQCDRCLQPVTIPLDLIVSEEFFPAPEEVRTKRNDKGKEDEEVFQESNQYLGETIDLTQVLKDNVILGLPMKILCREDCFGFCHMCGQDLNESKCQCQIETIDPRLANLKALLNSDQDS